MPASGQNTEPALPEQPVSALLRLATVKHRFANYGARK